MLPQTPMTHSCPTYRHSPVSSPPAQSGPYRAMRAAMRCKRQCVLNTEMAMRCDAEILAMRVLVAEILCDALPRCENTSDAMPRCCPLSSSNSPKSPHGVQKMDFRKSLYQGLVAPYRAILRYYHCDTPYCAILFKGV